MDITPDGYAPILLRVAKIILIVPKDDLEEDSSDMSTQSDSPI